MGATFISGLVGNVDIPKRTEADWFGAPVDRVHGNHRACLNDPKDRWRSRWTCSPRLTAHRLTLLLCWLMRSTQRQSTVLAAAISASSQIGSCRKRRWLDLRSAWLCIYNAKVEAVLSKAKDSQRVPLRSGQIAGGVLRSAPSLWIFAPVDWSSWRSLWTPTPTSPKARQVCVLFSSSP